MPQKLYDTVRGEWHQFASVDKLKHCFTVDTAIANELGLPVTPEPIRMWKYGCDRPLSHSKTSVPLPGLRLVRAAGWGGTGNSGKVFPSACGTALLWVVLERRVLRPHLYLPLTAVNECLAHAGP